MNEPTDTPCCNRDLDCHGFVMSDGACESCGHEHIHCGICDEWVSAEHAVSDCVCCDCAEPEDDEQDVVPVSEAA